jgi:hypothetical protein
MKEILLVSAFVFTIGVMIYSSWRATHISDS